MFSVVFSNSFDKRLSLMWLVVISCEIERDKEERQIYVIELSTAMHDEPMKIIDESQVRAREFL